MVVSSLGATLSPNPTISSLGKPSTDPCGRLQTPNQNSWHPTQQDSQGILHVHLPLTSLNSFVFTAVLHISGVAFKFNLA